MPATATLPAFLPWLCDQLVTRFAGDRTQTMWEGHLTFEVVQILLDAVCVLEFGEPGGDNTEGLRISRSGVPAGQKTARQDVKNIARDYADLVVAKVAGTDVGWRLQFKTYPSTGNKRGRAGTKGFGKDLTYVDAMAPATAAFVFVADSESYDGLRGVRRDARGPEIKTTFPLPDLTTMNAPLLANVDTRRGTFRRISTTEGSDRVVAGIWRE